MKFVIARFLGFELIFLILFLFGARSWAKILVWFSSSGSNLFEIWKWQSILGEPWPAMLGMHPILYGLGNGRARGCLLASIRSVDREGSPCPCASPRTDEASFKQFLVQVMKANVASEDATEAWLEYRIFDLMDGLGGPASKNILEILMQG